MNLPDILEFIAVGFRADRFKTLMSSLGIIIGVMAIVVMLSVGEGLYSGVSSQFSTLNLDMIRVIPGSAHFGGPGSDQANRNPAEPAKFTEKDTKVLENVVGVKNVAPQTIFRCGGLLPEHQCLGQPHRRGPGQRGDAQGRCGSKAGFSSAPIISQ